MEGRGGLSIWPAFNLRYTRTLDTIRSPCQFGTNTHSVAGGQA